jgi:DNA polymerase-1
MLPPFFDRIYVIDFEFVALPGERPQPVCLVSHEINSGETEKIWLEGKDPSTLIPPYSMGETDLLISYYSSAEWGCHLVLNWPLPINVVDLYSEFRLLTNGLPGISKGLLGACQMFGVSAISGSEKEAARIRIMQGPPYTEEEKENILTYCASDVLETAELLKKMLPYIDIPRALIRGRYMETIAEMEQNGIPIDTVTLERLKTN